MGEEPSGFVSDLYRPMKLMGAEALLARGHERIRLKPDVKLDVAGLHDGLGRHGKVLAALLGVAPPDASLLGLVMTADRAAMRADRLAGPAEGFEVLPGFVVVLKLRGGEHGGSRRCGTKQNVE